MTHRKTLGLAMALCMAVSGAAAAKPPLRDVAYVDDGLFQIALADMIRKGCSDIDARLLKAFGVLRDLKRHAVSLGYTEAEIEAHVDSDIEKDRMRARGDKLFAARNVNPSNPDDLCRMGREEIANKSPVGQLLRAK